jgi:hypothetical protein
MRYHTDLVAEREGNVAISLREIMRPNAPALLHTPAIETPLPIGRGLRRNVSRSETATKDDDL